MTRAPLRNEKSSFSNTPDAPSCLEVAKIARKIGPSGTFSHYRTLASVFSQNPFQSPRSAGWFCKNLLQPRLSKRDEASTGKQLSKDYAYDSTTTNSDPDINPKNQLPPVVQVTLVAIDETSANRLANGTVAQGFDQILDTLFFDTSKLDTDLNILQNALSEFRPAVSFRIFTTNVGIRGAKWSRK